MTVDGQSFLFAETWGCRVQRYWFAGPKAGKREIVIENLPGYPDNINRASDGNYWLALVGMRTPAFDLAWRMPGFRRRMANRIAPDEWLYPNINTGCVVKFDENGKVLDCLWDLHGDQPSDDHLDARAQGLPLSRRHLQQPHRQMAHSRRRSELERRRILLGSEAVIGVVRRAWDRLRGGGDHSVTVPPMDGALQSQQPARRSRDRSPRRTRRTICA